jgi:hypothetical protein
MKSTYSDSQIRDQLELVLNTRFYALLSNLNLPEWVRETNREYEKLQRMIVSKRQG